MFLIMIFMTTGIWIMRLELWDCNRVGQILIPNLWPRPFLPKKSQKRAKSNANFHLKGRRDTALISISASFMGLMGAKVGTKRKNYLNFDNMQFP